MTPLCTPDPSIQNHLFSEIFSVCLFPLKYRILFLVHFAICAISGVFKRRKFSFPLKITFVLNTAFIDTASMKQFFSLLRNTFIISYYSFEKALPGFLL